MRNGPTVKINTAQSRLESTLHMAKKAIAATATKPDSAQGLFQSVLHVFKAVFVDQRADQIAFQRMANAHFGIGGLEAGDDLFLHRLMCDQATQGGATLAGGADRTEQDGTHGHVQVGAGAKL